MRRDGSWHYKGRQDVAPVPTMTCAGLLGLAVGHGLANEAKAGEQKADGDPAIERGLKHLSNSSAHRREAACASPP